MEPVTHWLVAKGREAKRMQKKEKSRKSCSTLEKSKTAVSLLSLVFLCAMV